MEDNRRRTQEVTRLSLAMLAGEALPEQVARLNSLIESDPQVASTVLEIVGQETWLAWSSKELTAATPSQGVATMSKATGGVAQADDRIMDRPGLGQLYSCRLERLVAAASILLIAGVFCGAFVARGLNSNLASDEQDLPRYRLTSFSGRILNASACRWTPDSLHSTPDGVLLQGQSLNVLEGIAEVLLEWPTGMSKLAIEGPSGVVLTSEEGCYLSHGRLTADVSTSGSNFRIDARNCQLNVDQNALLGVLANGLTVEVHVFQGDAMVVVPWSSREYATQHIGLFQGDSLTIAEDSEGNIQVSHGAINYERFVSCSSMDEDKLTIPESYVTHVQSLAPLLYWRFEGTEEEVLASSSQSGVTAQLHGNISILQEADNQFLDIGETALGEKLSAYIVSSEPLSADFEQGYSLELWFKPSAVHRGVLASLISAVQPDTQASDHGMLLELGGPRVAKPALEMPGRIRYLHRSPPSGDIDVGTSCFSESTYALRRWQHIVAVKDTERLRLYVDGVLSSAALDETQLGPGLRLLLGKIDEVRQYRQFVGQLDEVAFYARPLTPEEILHHCRLIRPENESVALKSPSTI